MMVPGNTTLLLDPAPVDVTPFAVREALAAGLAIDSAVGLAADILFHVAAPLES
jgi:hypothetical protein